MICKRCGRDAEVHDRMIERLQDALKTSRDLCDEIRNSETQLKAELSRTKNALAAAQAAREMGEVRSYREGIATFQRAEGT